MIKVNKFVQGLKPSSTLAINQKVQKLRESNEKIFHFGFGQSPFAVHDTITTALSCHVTDNGYLPTKGLRILRREISKFLKNYQCINYDSDCIFIGPGSKELLYQTILILDGIFLIPKGSWVSYLPQIKSKNGAYNILETQFNNNFKLTPEVLNAYCINNQDIQKILILNSPNNPTGAVYLDSELEELAKVCKEFEIIVISDEIYSQINFDKNYSPSISKYYSEKTIVFGGLSKVFSAGGYRLGFMALPSDLMQLNTVYQSLFSETFSAVASPIQYAAITAYRYENSLQNYVNDCSNILKLISKFVYNLLTNIGVECTRPQGAFYIMIGFSNFEDKFYQIGVSGSNQLADYLLNNYKVALLPGTDFYFQKEELFFRLAFVDFDGPKVLRAYRKYSGDDELFVKLYCSSIYKGANQIVKCINDLEC